MVYFHALMRVCVCVCVFVCMCVCVCVCVCVLCLHRPPGKLGSLASPAVAVGDSPWMADWVTESKNWTMGRASVRVRSQQGGLHVTAVTFFSVPEHFHTDAHASNKQYLVM